MASREEYNKCMIPFISGSKPQEQRKLDFCTGAKVCSKGISQEEAMAICLQPKEPKPPKAKKGRKVCTLRDLEAITTCLVQNINLSGLTAGNMQSVFSDALKKCSGATAGKVKSAKMTLESLDPQQIKALETIALLSSQAEGRKW